MFYLITTPSCPNCPRAKKIIEAQDQSLSVQILDASTDDGFQKAQKWNISQVPSLVQVGQNDQVLKRHVGISQIYDFFSS